MSDPSPVTEQPTIVSARPIRTARLAMASAAVVFVVMVAVAFLEPSHNAGAHFGVKDQVFTVIIGVILAVGLLLPTRPRLVADADGVRVRGFVGAWKTVPWELVQRVEFPSNARLARLVLPGEELIAIAAVQRYDREQAVSAMRGLRGLFAATRATQEKTPPQE